MTAQILCVGVHILDTIALPVDEVPKQQNSVRISQILHVPGGTAAGCAVDIAHLGGDVTTVGVVGADETGEILITMLERRGVSTKRLTKLDGAQTSSSVLLVDSNGIRPALHVRGVNALATWKDLDLNGAEDAKFIHLGGLDAMSNVDRAEIRRFVQRVRAAGATVSLDFQSSAQHLTGELLDIVNEVDIFLPNDEQAMGLTGAASVPEAAKILLQGGVGSVVITCGADGIYFENSEEQVRVPSFPAEIVDTTGCGDSVSAAFLVARSRDHSLRDSLTIASAAGAAVAEGAGSLGKLPKWDELCERAGVSSSSKVV
ncbi:MAG: carbohydrate kinase family protein [Leucobacter sp.]